MRRRGILAASLSATVGYAGTWPQWRGPNRDGLLSDQGWPADLNNLKLLWRVPMSEGYPGPIVGPDRVYTAETQERKREKVRALDRLKGTPVWEREWPGAMSVPFFAKSNGDWIRATPVLDGDSLYVSGMRDELYCLSVADGAIRWRVGFFEQVGSSPSFGAVCSPLVLGEHLFIQAGNAFVKLNKSDGTVVWRRLESKNDAMESGAFSSPIYTQLAGVPQFLVQTRTQLCGVEPIRGDILWSQKVPAFRGMNILTPTVYKGGVFTSTYQNKSYFYRPTNTTTGWKVETVWENKSAGYMSSPVCVDGHLYLHNQAQRLVCIDLMDGKTKWTSTDRFGKYWSMASSDGRLLALDQNGTLYLFQANPARYELLAKKKISEQETWGHLAVADRQLFIRELNALAAYSWSA